MSGLISRVEYDISMGSVRERFWVRPGGGLIREEKDDEEMEPSPITIASFVLSLAVIVFMVVILYSEMKGGK